MTVASVFAGVAQRTRAFGARPLQSAALDEAQRLTLAWRLGILAIALNLTVSSNLLYICGIKYSASGGLILHKFHPGTYMAFFSFAALLMVNNRPWQELKRCIATNPATMLFLGMIATSFLIGLIANGLSGTAVYIESYAPACLLTLLIDRVDDERRKRLTYIMLGLFAVSIVISLCETLIGERLIPIYLGDERAEEDPGEFRGTGLYDHPLTGASFTMLAMFLLLKVPLKPAFKGALFVLFLIGLISFGGRTALVLTLLSLTAWGAISMVRQAIEGTLSLATVGIALGAMIAVPLLIVVVMTQTPIGERIMARMYWDDSANTRVIQLLVVGHMTMFELWFGTAFERVKEIVFQIGLQFPFNDIENFWLVMMVNLGLVGFTCFLIGILGYFLHLWRRSKLAGRIALTALVLVASSSNSLGRKSNLLTIGVPVVLLAGAPRLWRESSYQRPRPVADRRGPTVFQRPFEPPTPRSTALSGTSSRRRPSTFQSP